MCGVLLWPRVFALHMPECGRGEKIIIYYSNVGSEIKLAPASIVVLRSGEPIINEVIPEEALVTPHTG